MAIGQQMYETQTNRGAPHAPHVRLWLQLLLVPIVALVFIQVWELVVRWADYPPFILPGPAQVWASAVTLVSDGTLWRNTIVTLGEVLAGLFVGMTVAFVLGYLLSRSRTVEQLLTPYIVASQSIPTVAIAPLLVIWFDAGAASKVTISALTVFFPILVSCIAGLRSAEPELLDLMRSLQATRWQTFTRLELPAALPHIISGLKVGATLSVIGAVVGEFVGADRGLGFLVKQGQGIYDTPLMFVAVFTLIAIALSLYGLVALFEHRALAWKK